MIIGRVIRFMRKRALFLRLGLSCNNNCVFCVTGRDTRMAFDFAAIQDFLRTKRDRYNFLVLTGGEPTIRRDFFDIVDMAGELGYSILLQTNGRLFAFKKFCEKIRHYPVKFSININGPTAKIHDAATNAPGSFTETVRGIKNLLEFDADILVKIPLLKDNYTVLDKTAKKITGWGVRAIMFVFLTPYGSASKYFDSVVPRYTDVSVSLVKTIHWLENQPDISIHLEGFPHCCLAREFHGLISETRFTEGSMDGLIPEDARAVYNCKRERVHRQKQKFPGCEECVFYKKCEGVYREYVNKMGQIEFQPVTGPHGNIPNL